MVQLLLALAQAGAGPQSQAASKKRVRQQFGRRSTIYSHVIFI